MDGEGLCECGCGDRAPIATMTRSRWGHVKGRPVRFIRGHHNRGKRWAVDPNPSGLCMCGCGQPVGLRSKDERRKTPVHWRYMPGHFGRKSPAEYVAEDRGYSSPCWIWRRKVTKKGYGLVKDGKRERHAHRVVYERTHEPLDPHIELHHLCRNRGCVNPAHLEPLTKAAHLALHRAERSAA